MSNRAGQALPELLVTLALSGIVGTALGSVLLTHLQLARVVAARAATADGLRVTLQAVPGEVRLAAPADIRGGAGDSLAARLSRLSGTVCARSSGRIWIRASGMREPDVRKDSVLLVSAAGERAVAPAAVVEDAGPCPPGAGQTRYRLDLPGALDGSAAVLLFESGTYYLRERAFRLRMGAEGRQPITEELFVDGASRFSFRFDSGWARLHVRLVARPAFGHSMAAPAEITFTLLNAPAGR